MKKRWVIKQLEKFARPTIENLFNIRCPIRRGLKEWINYAPAILCFAVDSNEPMIRRTLPVEYE